jgi:hypothetical protein
VKQEKTKEFQQGNVRLGKARNQGNSQEKEFLFLSKKTLK